MSPLHLVLVVFLVLLGLALVYLDFFLQTGLLGVLAVVFLLGSIFFVWTLHLGISTTFTYGIIVLAATTIVSKLALSRLRKKTELKNGSQDIQMTPYDASCIGKIGVVLIDLKPTGSILIEGKEFQALSEVGYISKGMQVIVMHGRGAYLIVKKV